MRGWSGFAAGVATALVVLSLGWIGFVYSGAYDVAATDEHMPFVRWSFETAMHNSVEARASEIPAAPLFDDAAIAAGASEFKAMCEHCHGGPGVERAEWATGILPRPPELTHAAAEWDPEEIHWIVRHGVKMTAMPAFGPTHDDETLWNIVAFVDRLPSITPEEYAGYGGGHGHAEEGAHAPAAEHENEPRSSAPIEETDTLEPPAAL